jgi:cationic amino acid transporter 4
MASGDFAKSLLRQTSRTKEVTSSFLTTELRRCLTTFDITLIGVGHMIGAGWVGEIRYSHNSEF